MYTEEDTLDELFRSRLAGESVSAPSFNWQGFDHELAKREAIATGTETRHIARSSPLLKWLSSIMLIIASGLAIYGLV